MALSRLLSSREFRGSGRDATVRVEFPDSYFDLTKPDIALTKDNTMGVQYRAGGAYSVWGIELGFRPLELEEDQTAFDGLSKLLRGTQLPLPSHIIIYTWSNSDYHNETTYTVHRLTQKQEELLDYLKKENRSVAH